MRVANLTNRSRVVAAVSATQIVHDVVGAAEASHEGVEYQVLLGLPAAVDARLAGLGPNSHGLDRERGIADLGQFGEDGVMDRVLECHAAPALARCRCARHCGHLSPHSLLSNP